MACLTCLGNASWVHQCCCKCFSNFASTSEQKRWDRRTDFCASATKLETSQLFGNGLSPACPHLMCHSWKDLPHTSASAGWVEGMQMHQPKIFHFQKHWIVANCICQLCFQRAVFLDHVCIMAISQPLDQTISSGVAMRLNAALVDTPLG